MLSCEAVRKFEDLEAKYVAHIEKGEAYSTAAAKMLLGEAFATISEAKIIDTAISGDSVRERKKIDSSFTAALK